MTSGVSLLIRVNARRRQKAKIEVMRRQEPANLVPLRARLQITLFSPHRASRTGDHDPASGPRRSCNYIRATMANEGQAGRGLDSIASSVKRAGAKGLPPVLVRLFASVLRREGGKYFLVTPVEQCGIAVDDVPFLAVELYVEQDTSGRILHFRTNVDDWVACGPGHALRFEPEPETGGLKPYVHVRRELWAKVTRALFYDLVELGEERDVEGERMFGVVSGGEFFAMAPAAQIKDLL